MAKNGADAASASPPPSNLIWTEPLKPSAFFGDSQRFLQAVDLKPVKTKDDDSNSLSKLDFALAAGSNPTLFDHAGNQRNFDAPSQALNLVTFQCFSPSGTIGVGLWAGKPTRGWTGYPKPTNGYSAHAPCVAGSMFHVSGRLQPARDHTSESAQ